jgi:iron(III) transport system substrate-binding protein
MRDSRRDVLKVSTALAAGVVFPVPLKAAGPAPTAVSQAMIEAARKEHVVAFYTAMEIPLAESLEKAFETKYPGIDVRVKRSGAERVFQRIGKEEEINIYGVDVVCSTDAGHFINWKRDGLLMPYVPEDVAKHFPPEQVDLEGMYATVFALLSPISYNTNLVRPEDAPKSFADLLDPKWKGKISKGRPDYSGTVLTATFQIARDLGWPYFEKLAQQNITHVQSGIERGRSLRSARAPYRPTAPIPTCCCSRNRVHQSNLFIRPRARR